MCCSQLCCHYTIIPILACICSHSSATHSKVQNPLWLNTRHKVQSSSSHRHTSAAPSCVCTARWYCLGLRFDSLQRMDSWELRRMDQGFGGSPSIKCETSRWIPAVNWILFPSCGHLNEDVFDERLEDGAEVTTWRHTSTMTTASDALGNIRWAGLVQNWK